MSFNNIQSIWILKKYFYDIIFTMLKQNELYIYDCVYIWFKRLNITIITKTMY